MSTVFDGQPAVDVFRATVFISAIRMMKLGMRPNRMYTWKALAEQVSLLTGEKFTGKRDADAMVAALDAYKRREAPNAKITHS